MKGYLCILKPWLLFALSIMLWWLGFEQNGLLSIVFYLFAFLIFNRAYTIRELNRAVVAYLRGEEHQIGFTLRNNIYKLFFHLTAVSIIFFLSALFFERIQSQVIFLLMVFISLLFVVANMHSIDKDLDVVFNSYMEQYKETMESIKKMLRQSEESQE